MCGNHCVSLILWLLRSRDLSWQMLMINTLWWCRLTDCASSSVLNALVASDLYFLFFHGQMSKLFLMALTERLGSRLEHQLPAAKALAVLRFHHVHSFMPLGLEAVANRTVLLGAWAGANAAALCSSALRQWDGRIWMLYHGCLVLLWQYL